jgi:hypothetical protein
VSNKKYTILFGVMMISVGVLNGQGIVVNEVMSNVKGTDSGIGSPGDRNEFVEVYNPSNDTVDLSLFLITDGDAIDDIIPWTDTLLIDPDVITGTTLLPPDGYGVILDPEYTDTGDGNYMQPYDFPSQTIIVTVGNTTIGDGLSTTDVIVLLTTSDDTVSTYGTPGNLVDNIPYDPGDGFSVERTSPLFPDNELHWETCLDSLGATPGRENSCVISGGLVFPSHGFTVSPREVQIGQTVSISVLCQNLSEDTLAGATVEIFHDSDWDSSCSETEMISQEILTEPIPPYGCTLRVETSWNPLSEGNKRLAVKSIQSTHSETFTMVKVGSPIGEVILNEVMYAPERGGEWVELFNRSPWSIDISGWRLLVGNDTIVFHSDEYTLNPSEFFLIVEDRSYFHTKWGNVDCAIGEAEGWVSLTNDGDTISLDDEKEFEFDRMLYTDESENGVSLERINPNISSLSSWNWGSSCNYRGATPGRINSIHATSKETKTVLAVSPNPFSPNGDGYEERTIVSYELPFYQAIVNLSLYTSTGVRMCIFMDEEDSGKSGSYVWDGKDSEGENMPIGLYIIFLEAVDKMSNKRIVQKTPVVIAGRR